MESKYGFLLEENPRRRRRTTKGQFTASPGKKKRRRRRKNPGGMLMGGGLNPRRRRRRHRRNPGLGYARRPSGGGFFARGRGASLMSEAQQSFTGAVGIFGADVVGDGLTRVLQRFGSNKLFGSATPQKAYYGSRVIAGGIAFAAGRALGYNNAGKEILKVSLAAAMMGMTATTRENVFAKIQGTPKAAGLSDYEMALGALGPSDEQFGEGEYNFSISGRNDINDYEFADYEMSNS